MRIATAVVVILTFALLAEAAWTAPAPGAGGAAPAEINIFNSQPGLKITVQKVTVLPPAAGQAAGDWRTLEVVMEIVDTSGASSVGPNANGVALFDGASGSVGGFQDYHGQGGMHNGPQGLEAYDVATILFRVPANIEELLPRLTLRLPVVRYRDVPVEFSFGEPGKALTFPVTKEQGGVSVTLTGLEIGTIWTPAQIASIHALGGKVEQDLPHLILGYEVKTVVMEGGTPIPAWEAQATAVGGKSLKTSCESAQRGRSDKVADGIRFIDMTAKIHFPDTPEKLDLETVKITTHRHIPIDDNWLSLTPPATQGGGK